MHVFACEFVTVCMCACVCASVWATWMQMQTPFMHVEGLVCHGLNVSTTPTCASLEYSSNVA